MHCLYNTAVGVLLSYAINLHGVGVLMLPFDFLMVCPAKFVAGSNGSKDTVRTPFRTDLLFANFFFVSQQVHLLRKK